MPHFRLFTILSLSSLVTSLFATDLSCSAKADLADLSAANCGPVLAAAIQKHPGETLAIVSTIAKAHPGQATQLLQCAAVSAPAKDLPAITAELIKAVPTKAKDLAPMAALQLSCTAPEQLEALGAAVAQALPGKSADLIGAMYAATFNPDSKEAAALLNGAMNATGKTAIPSAMAAPVGE